MRAYRHWDRQWADEFERLGRIRLQPLSFYAQHFDIPGIQDDLENAQPVRQRAAIDAVQRPLRHDERAVLMNVGIAADHGPIGLVAFDNEAVWQGEQVYVLCLSRRAEVGYLGHDDVTAIANVSRFASAILAVSDGKFRRCVAQSVRYDAAVHLAEDGKVPAPDPFRKFPQYAAQEEVRIALYPSEPLEGPVVLESPRLFEATQRRQR